MSSLEAQIGQLRGDIQKYNALVGKIMAVISKLRAAARDASDLRLEVRSSFKVDGESALVTGRIEGLKGNVEGTADYLSKTVLPAITGAIDGANGQISALEAEIERQRREAEEAARRAEEERLRQEEEARLAAERESQNDNIY